MNWFARWLIGCLIFVAILAFGWYVLGIHWTVAELLLIVLATSFSNGVEGGLK